jgi:hypothetical protein
MRLFNKLKVVCSLLITAEAFLAPSNKKPCLSVQQTFERQPRVTRQALWGMTKPSFWLTRSAGIGETREEICYAAVKISDMVRVWCVL